jgi:hypothetical protein
MTSLKRSVSFSTSAINKAFTEGSSSWAEAMTRNMHVGIKAVQDGMRDGKISTRSGMKEISRLVDGNMQVASNSMDKLSAAGKARLAQNFRDAADAVRDQMRRAGKVTKAGMEEVTGPTWQKNSRCTASRSRRLETKSSLVPALTRVLTKDLEVLSGDRVRLPKASVSTTERTEVWLVHTAAALRTITS